MSQSWRQLVLPGLGVTRAMMINRAARMAAVSARTRRGRWVEPTSILVSNRKAAKSCGFCQEHGYDSCAAPSFCFGGT